MGDLKDGLNVGLMICLLKSAKTGNVIENGKAVIPWIQTDETVGGRLQLFDTDGNKTDTVRGVSDDSGVALIEFFWDPVQIHHFIDDAPLSRVVYYNSDYGDALEITDRGLISDTKVKRTFKPTAFGRRFHFCVNLGQIWHAGTGQFELKDSGTSSAIDALKYIQKILDFRAKIKNQKVPNSKALRVMRPSIEMYGLLGAIEMNVPPL